MGLEIQVDNLEDMCSLMCDNYIPEHCKKSEEKWIFTFGFGHEHQGHYVTFSGSYGEARQKMCDIYGTKWGFQYSEKEWNKMKNDPTRTWPMETELEVTDNGYDE